MKIRAAVLEEFGVPLAVQEVDLADPAPATSTSTLSTPTASRWTRSTAASS
jgi:hypothetical protein